MDTARLIGRGAVWFVLPAALGLGLGVGYGFTATPTYMSSEDIFVRTVLGSRASVAEQLAGSDYAMDRMSSYAQLVYSPDVLEAVKNDLQVPDAATLVAKHVTVTVPTKQVILKITAMDDDPEGAQKLAAATGRALSREIERREKPADQRQSLVEVSVARAATLPSAPDSPNPKISAAIGVVGGMALGGGLYLLHQQAEAARRVASIQAAKLGTAKGRYVA